MPGPTHPHPPNEGDSLLALTDDISRYLGGIKSPEACLRARRRRVFATLPRDCSHVRRASRRKTRSTYNRHASARGGGGDGSKSNQRFLIEGTKYKVNRVANENDASRNPFVFRPSYISCVCPGVGARGGGLFFFFYSDLPCEVARWITQCIGRQRNFV
jgi:hypothetical protein